LSFDRICPDFGFAPDRATTGYGDCSTSTARSSGCRRIIDACWAKSGSKPNICGHPEVASSVTVVTAQDIEIGQRRTLPDVLSTVPGINVVQTGGAGGPTSVFMRGTNSNHVKVPIDGIDVSDPSNPNRSFDFGQLLTTDIAQVEILRGPQSGLYGEDPCLECQWIGHGQEIKKYELENVYAEQQS
jgi:hypothetical protein